MSDTSGNSIPLLGEFTVEVEYLNKTSQLPLLVSSNEKMPLIIGTNWFGHVDIDFNSIFASITFAEDAKTAKAKSVIILESKEMFKPVQSNKVCTIYHQDHPALWHSICTGRKE